jgi:hypothetical protein
MNGDASATGECPSSHRQCDRQDWRSLAETKGALKNTDKMGTTQLACRASDTTWGYHLQAGDWLSVLGHHFEQGRHEAAAQRLRRAASTRRSPADPTRRILRIVSDGLLE